MGLVRVTALGFGPEVAGSTPARSRPINIVYSTIASSCQFNFLARLRIKSHFILDYALSLTYNKSR